MLFSQLVATATPRDTNVPSFPWFPGTMKIPEIPGDEQVASKFPNINSSSHIIIQTTLNALKKIQKQSF